MTRSERVQRVVASAVKKHGTFEAATEALKEFANDEHTPARMREFWSECVTEAMGFASPSTSGLDRSM